MNEKDMVEMVSAEEAKWLDMTQEELIRQCRYLRKECDKLNAELREMTSNNNMLKETIVKMAMAQNGIN